MSIKWKSLDKFKPRLILQRIDAIRTIDEEGKFSYHGIVIDESIPTLSSMLNFPAVARDIDKEILIWRSINKAGKELTPESFIKAANTELTALLATKEVKYFILTTISAKYIKGLRQLSVLDCKISFYDLNFPKKYIKHRNKIITDNQTDIKKTPSDYLKIVIGVRAKSPNAAYHKAMRALDLCRAFLCLMSNPYIQISFGQSEMNPVNNIHPGGDHTIHLASGKIATDSYWYEPNFKPTAPHKFSEPEIIVKQLRWSLNQINSAKFRDVLVSSLLMYVRGFDLSDHNSAFLKAWAALELLTTPNIADYDKLIRRTSYLFNEIDYHKQVLEHLRTYRNSNIHAGEESDNAKIHCYQIQIYYRQIIWFIIKNAHDFKSIDDFGNFLDLPHDRKELEEYIRKIKKAINFRFPSKT